VKKEELPEIKKIKPVHILDKWIISKIEHLISSAEFNMDKYDVAKAVLAVEDFFINDLSLWYVRRSRKRFHEMSPDRRDSIETFYYILLRLTQLLAPVMPFFAEQMYQELKTQEMPESVHLCDGPEGCGHTDLELEQNMEEVRSVVAMALAERNLQAIKVRQPLASLKIKNQKSKIKNNSELLELIKDEINVKEIVFDDTIEKEVALDTNITEELKIEGMLREIIRDVQSQRKEAQLKPEDKISVEISASKEIAGVIEKNKEMLLKEMRAIEMSIEINLEDNPYKIIIKP
jgi:isoleucyl-tRNA synthetase